MPIQSKPAEQRHAEKLAERILVLQSAFLAVSGFDQFLNTELSVRIEAGSKESQVKFFSITDDKSVSVKLTRKAAGSNWTVNKLTALPATSVTKSETKISALAMFGKLLPQLQHERWITKDSFHFQAYSSEKQYDFWVSIGAHMEWNKRYITCDLDGKLLRIETGY